MRTELNSDLIIGISFGVTSESKQNIISVGDELRSDKVLAFVVRQWLGK